MVHADRDTMIKEELITVDEVDAVRAKPDIPDQVRKYELCIRNVGS
jgi:hypothetical protein